MVTAHSGALAGEHGAYEALFERLRRARVRTLDEMADTMELFSLPAARARRQRASRACTTAAASGRCSPTWPPTSACRSRRSRTRRVARIARPARPGHGGGEPARRLGDRDRRRPRSSSRRSRRSRDDPEVGAQRVLRRPDPPGRALRRGLPADRDRRVRGDRQAVLRAVEPRERGVGRRGRDIFATRASRCSREPTAGCGRCGICSRHRLARARPAVPPPIPVATRSGNAGARGSATASRCRRLEGLALLADYGVPVVAARAAATRRRGDRRRRRDRVPRRAEDGRAGHHAQVRCRRRAARARPTPTRSRDATRTSPGASGPQVVVAAMAPAGVEVALGVVARPARSARWCWLRPAACSWSCCTTGASRSRRSTRTGRAG